MKQIEVQNLTKNYGNQKGIFDLNFSVKEGEVFGFLGPNGAGKTTTIRHLMGFIRPDSGTAAIMGMDCFAKREQIQEKLGYLPGEIAMPEDITGIGYLKLMRELKGVKDTSRMEELIDFFELDTRGPVRKMSKGMKQKVAIVAAFMQNPNLLILDEPTSGLDPLMQNRFIELLLKEKKKGTTILLSTHIFEEVEKTCDRTAIIRAGKLVTVENMDSMANKKKKTYTVTFTDVESAASFAEKNELQDAKVEKTQVSFSVSGKPGVILERIAKANPLDVDIRTQTLEELFLHYYGEEAAK